MQPMRNVALLALVAGVSFAISPGFAADTPPVPQTMLAAAMDKGGGPEVLTIHRLPVPKPKSGEVLIAVRAAGVSVWEAPIRQRMGALANPMVLGFEGAGIVAALGPGVKGFSVGDEVYGTSSRFDAEYVIAKAEHLARIPKGISLAQAGILATSGLSALQGIDDVLHLRPGDTLIIHGAAGGVGTLAVQFAKLRGARVLATASTEDGLTLLKKLGADALVNGRSGDISAAAQRFAPNGVDAVLGLAGGDALERCIDAVRRDGKGRVAFLYGMDPLPKPRSGMSMILYSFVGGAPEYDRLNQAAKAAKLQVPIAAEYPLEATAAAHTRLEAGHLLGKIVLLAPANR